MKSLKFNKAMISKYFSYSLLMYFFLSPLELYVNSVVNVSSFMRLLGLLICFEFFLLILFGEKIRIRSFHTTLLVFIFFFATSLFWSDNASMYQSKISSWCFVSLFFVIVTVLDVHSQYTYKYMKALIIGTFISSVVLNINFFLSPSISRQVLHFMGNEMDPNNIAANLIFAVSLSFYFILLERRYFFYSLIIASSIFSLLLTGSRGGMVSLATVLVFLIISHNEIKKRKKQLILTMLIVLLSVTFIINYVPERTLNRVFSVENYSTGESNSRVQIWEFALQYFNDKPVFGYGLGSFYSISSRFFWRGFAMHNTMLLLLFEFGIMGFSIFFLFISQILIKLISKKCTLGLLLIMSGFLPSLFLDAYTKRFFWNGIILAVLLSQKSIDVSR